MKKTAAAKKQPLVVKTEVVQKLELESSDLKQVSGGRSSGCKLVMPL